MGSQRNGDGYRLLRIARPELYGRLMEELAEANIHSYDIRADCRDTEDGTEIRVSCGEGFREEAVRVFPQDEAFGAFGEFSREVRELCKKTMMEDYLRMIKP
ncbi:hypothetical protein [Indiicoccus explosivorum]|uniref:hypothetical protein n=1 Tax=Indiicoccus explosivorum TaxID=1917864 RepID=UPI000B44246F|nr:hypothetical protein [Indiicoccus explosivorum]